MSTAGETTPSHSENLFRTDLQASPFTAGVDRGWWRVASVQWPSAVLELALPARAGADDWLALRFQLDGYPEAPTAQPWDTQADAPLPPHRWPAGNGRIALAFNPGWRQDALYIPMDRQALDGHPEWRTRYACHTWDPGKDITQYLRLVRMLINDEGYSGARGQ
jgi:hypothetical protein